MIYLLCFVLLRQFLALLIVVTFWLMTTQSCEYLFLLFICFSLLLHIDQH